MPIRLHICLFTVFAFAFIFDSSDAQERSYNQLVTALSNPTVSPSYQPARSHMPRRTEETAKKEIPKHGVIRYDIYRDRRPYPIDPRKPCHICVQRESNSKFAAMQSKIYGFQGRPYQDKEPGGCLCGKKKQKFKHLNVNVYWPTFADGLPEEWFPGKSAKNESNLCRFKLTKIFDKLGGWELSAYERPDSGYCGPWRDRYGCLGESKVFQSNVTGVGFREPGQPVERGRIAFP